MAGSRSARAASVILTGSTIVAGLHLTFESADEFHFVGIENLEEFQPDLAAAMLTQSSDTSAFRPESSSMQVSRQPHR